MIEKPDESLASYVREHYSACELIFKKYKEMREVINDIYRLKYDVKDEIANTKEFEKGFIAGVKVMMSLFMDM